METLSDVVASAVEFVLDGMLFAGPAAATEAGR